MTGEEPGRDLAVRTFSVKEMVGLLGVSDTTTYEIIHRDRLPIIWDNDRIRIPRKEF